MRMWQQLIVQDIYANVRGDKILLPIGAPIGSMTPNSKRQSVMSMSGFSDRNRTLRSPSGSRVNALKRGSIMGAQSLMSDGRLSPTPSYATSIDEVSKGLRD